MMQAADRWPIPEQLLGLPDAHEARAFDLMVDSLMFKAYHEDEIRKMAQDCVQDVDVPNNS